MLLVKVASLKKPYTIWFQSNFFFKVNVIETVTRSVVLMGLGKQKSGKLVRFRAYL